jgi:hypothetical protein
MSAHRTVICGAVQKGVRFRAPLMHNGCAATILDVLQDARCGGGDAHGKTSQLGDAVGGFSTTAPIFRRMIAQGRVVLRVCGHRRRGHSPFKVLANPQGGAEQARAGERWEQ